MAPARTFDEALGARVRARREELGLTQDDVARRTSLLTSPAPSGFTRSVIAAIERGTRELSIPEIALLVRVLDTDLDGLLRGAGSVRDVGGATVLADDILDQLLGRKNVTLVVDQPANMFVSERAFIAAMPIGVAEEKAAAKLGVPVEAVSRTAYKLWGRPLTYERDARVAEASPKDAPARTIQALRGHITRGLLAELEPKIRRKR